MCLKNFLAKSLAMTMALLMFFAAFVSLPTTKVYAAGTTYYLDSMDGDDDNTGTDISQPWKSLSKLEVLTFGPGDKILLKAGSVFNSQRFVLAGSGNSESPIIIDMYGDGVRPIINGNGVSAVISLYNQEYWEINSLEITNDDDFDVDENGSHVHRRGISITVSDIPLVNHIYVRNCYIHDIDAYNEDKDSGGIIGRIEGSNPAAYFNDILFENNVFEKIDRTGINFAFNNTSGNVGYFNRNNSNVIIRNNTFDDIGGDGIIAIGCNSPLIEYNVFSYCRNRTTQASVAIFPWQCTNSVIQFNEAYLTQVEDVHSDGQAFDCDYGNDGTIFQYNYSHDNEGGFMLLCSPGDANAYERSYNSIVRYNISQNDAMRVFRLVGTGTRYSQIYNNTIYVGPDVVGNVVVNEAWDGLAGETWFENNIFYIQNGGTFYTGADFYYDHNLYYGVPGPTSDLNKINADPLLVNAGGAGIGIETCDVYKIQVGSPCINAGKVMRNNGGGLDFFGNVLNQGMPDIGAHEFGAQPYDPVSNPLPVPQVPEYYVTNSGFETGDLSGWGYWSADGTVIDNVYQQSGSYCVRLQSGWHAVNQTVENLKPNTTYTLIVWAKSDNLDVPIIAGVNSYADPTLIGDTPKDEKSVNVSHTEYEQVTITFTTGDDNTTANVFVYNPGGTGGYVDLIRIAQARKEPLNYVVAELVRNGDFESGQLSPWTGYGIYTIDNNGNAYEGDYCGMVDGSTGSSGMEQIITNLLPETAYTYTVWGKMENEGDSMGVGVTDFGGSQIAYDITSTTYEQITIQFTTGSDNTTAKIFVWKGSDGLGYVDNSSVIGPTDAPLETYELVYNRGFESGGLAPWNYDDTYEIVDHNQRSGQYCGKVEGPTGNGGITQIVENLLPNTTYLFSGWGKIENSGDGMGIGVTDFGATQIAYWVDSTDYTQITFSFTTGEHNTSAKIFVWKGSAGAGYIDDYSVIGPTSAVRVSEIHVAGQGSVSTVNVGNTLQMTADIAPLNATYNPVVWSVVNGTGSASIQQNGILTAVSAGTVTVKATALDGSDVAGTYDITITTNAGSSTDDSYTPPETPAITQTPSPTPSLNPTVVNGGAISFQLKPDNQGKVQVLVDPDDLSAAINNAENQKVAIKVIAENTAKRTDISIPAQLIEQIKKKQINDMVFDIGSATVSMSPEVLTAYIGEESKEVNLSIGAVDTASLSESIQKIIGNRTVYEFQLSIDDVKISNFTGVGMRVEVEMEYTLSSGENPEAIVVYYINDNGKLEIVKNGRYDALTKKVRFKASHFSKYAAAESKVSFSDTLGVIWAVESINALAAREVIEGVGVGTFNPNGSVTRTEFIKMLMTAFDLIDETAICTFRDVKAGEWYYPAVASAQKLGIVQGKGNGLFGVNDKISREEMAVMVHRVSLLIKAEFKQNTSVGFADSSQISAYAVESVEAMQKAGVIQGTGNNVFAPKSGARRAEAAVILYRMFGLVYQ